MDFGFDADQEALRALAKKALGHDDAWGELLRAGLGGVLVPVEKGGAGLGMVEACLVFEQAGRAAAPAAIVPSLIAGAARARFGTHEDRGEVTLALHEIAGDPARPATTIARAGAGWRIDGQKIAVPALERSAAILVPARTPDGRVTVAVVDVDARGLARESATATDESIVHQLRFDGVIVDEAALLGDAIDWILRRASVGFAAHALGIAARQLEMTAEHVVRRQQFGKPIGLFQAVGQRCADMHVDVESLRLAVWEAAYLLDSDGGSEEDARTIDAAVATAAFWATEAGARVAAAAQHLHAGIGFDRSYPLYRYFLAAKRVELELGGATRQLARLGRILAGEARS